jgi:Fungalysin/Thermolysin Propeptide Motif
MTSRFVTCGLFVWLIVQTTLPVPAMAQGAAGARRLVAVSSAQSIRPADALVDSLQRSGELRVRQHRADALKAGREHDRLNQYYQGVRVFGGDVARQTERSISRSKAEPTRRRTCRLRASARPTASRSKTSSTAPSRS